MSSFLGNNQINAKTPACSMCTCAAPQGMTCQMTGMADANHANTIDSILIFDAPCGGTINCGGPLEVPNNWTGTCYGPDGFPANRLTCGASANMTCSTSTGAACALSVQVSPTTVAGGTCTPSQQTPMIAPVAWDVAGEACGGAQTSTKGCNAGLTCMPKPQAPFVSGVCIYQTGDLTCPPGQFSQKHLLYQGSNDMRTCSDCACGAPAGGDCSAAVTIYSDGTVNTCNSLVATINVNSQTGACANLTGNPATIGRKATLSAPTGGSCPATGGQPMGTATPTMPTTFCCIP
jgi:hypothetical protein